MRARHLTSLVLGAALALSATACGDDGGGGDAGDKPAFPAGSTMDRIQKAGRLRVGTKVDQPLFGEKNPTTGGMEGFDVEIAKIIAAELGLDEDDVEFTESVSKNREPFIQDGKVDIVVATYTINDDRKKLVDFAGPYYVAGQDILVGKDDTSISGVEDLNGKKVCSVEGSTSEKNIREKAPRAQLTVFDSYSKCVEAMKDGRVVATSTDNVILLGLIAKNPEFKLVGRTFTVEPYGIGLKKGDAGFRDFLNDVLEEIYTDGRWAAAWTKTAGKVAGATPTPPPVNRY